MKLSKETLAVLKEEGYKSLEDYFVDISDEFDVPYEDVEALAKLLGENELFDGLLSTLEYR